MRIAGIVMFFIATIFIFGTDFMVKKGKISKVEDILKVKAVGTALLILSVIIMAIGS